MSISVGMKARKKQSSLSAPPEAGSAPPLEKSILALESACLRILENRNATGVHDTDRLYWQQRLKNIATPVSLALRECRGLRRFHNHYRHREDDEAVLRPVMEPCPITMLAQVCDHALEACRYDLLGVRDNGLNSQRRALEAALQGFLIRQRKA